MMGTDAYLWTVLICSSLLLGLIIYEAVTFNYQKYWEDQYKAPYEMKNNKDEEEYDKPTKFLMKMVSYISNQVNATKEREKKIVLSFCSVFLLFKCGRWIYFEGIFRTDQSSIFICIDNVVRIISVIYVIYKVISFDFKNKKKESVHQ
jgi:hypothetical protein